MKLTELQTGEAYTIYALSSGRDSPVVEFLGEAFEKMPDEADKLIALLERTAEHGVPKNKTKANTLGNGLFEFKTSGGIRILWFYDAGRVILCTHGFVKKRQTTPPKELKRARKAMKAYQEAKKTGRICYD